MAETNQTKYTEAFGAFAPALTVEELDSRIAKILEERFEKNNTREVKKFLHSTIDLTTLSGTDTEEKVAQLVASVNDFEGTEDVPPSQRSASIRTSSRPSVRSSLPRACK